MKRRGIDARLRMFEDAYELLRERTANAAETARKAQEDARKAKGIGRRIQLPKASF